MAKGGFFQNMKSQFTNPKPNSILYNRALLYFIFFVALVQLYSYGVSGRITLMVVFLLIGFLTTFFSKNMTVVLVISIVFTTLIQQIMNVRQFEGMEPKEGESAEAPKPKEGEPPKENTAEKPKPKEGESAEAPKPKEGEPPKENAAEAEKTKKELFVDGEALNKLNNQLIQGFSTLEPAIDKASQLVESMEQKANYLNKLGYTEFK